MTTREYIRQSLSRFNVSDGDVDLIIVDNGLDADSDVDVKQAKNAICKSLGSWLPVYSSVSEGGVSMSWNFEAVKVYYASLCKELGIEDTMTKPVIRDRSNCW